MIFQKLMHKCNKMFWKKCNSALERKSLCTINKILRNNCQLAFLMLVFYRRDDDSYSHSKETKSVQNTVGSFFLGLLFMLVLFPVSFLSVSDYHRHLLMYIMCFALWGDLKCLLENCKASLLYMKVKEYNFKSDSALLWINVLMNTEN